MPRFTSANRWAVLCVLIASHAIFAEELELRVRSIPLGDGAIDVVTSHRGTSRWLLCNLHDDEDTSVEAAKQILAKRPGRLVEVRHSGERNIEFRVSDRTYKFDPNRVFTAIGVKKTLVDLSTADEASQPLVEQFGKALIELYDLDAVAGVIALHNNSDERYAATNYLPDQELANEAEAVHIEPGCDADDFFFVTERRFFEALQARKLNVVLQNNETMTDDGSLSVYCAQQGKPYVNVEAQHGHLEVQVQMLHALFEVLDALPNAD